MQASQTCSQWDLDAAPDGWVDVFEFVAGSGRCDQRTSCRDRSDLLRRYSVPRQQVSDMIDWVVGDAYQDIAQVGFWINAVELCVFDERIHSGCSLAAIGAGADNCSCRWRRRAAPARSHCCRDSNGHRQSGGSTLTSTTTSSGRLRPVPIDPSFGAAATRTPCRIQVLAADDLDPTVADADGLAEEVAA